MSNYYDYTAVHNPFDEEIELDVASPVLNVGEKYKVKPKGILLLPKQVAAGVVTQISRRILNKEGKEFNDPSRLNIEKSLLSHKYKIEALPEETVQEESIEGQKEVKKEVKKENK